MTIDTAHNDQYHPAFPAPEPGTEVAMSKKDKREKHAKHQASYMERKRAEGLAWLAVWVPADSLADFKLLAQGTVDSTIPPDPALSALAEPPAWALRSGAALHCWLGARVAEADLGERAPPPVLVDAAAGPLKVAKAEKSAKPRGKRRKSEPLPAADHVTL